MQVANGTADVTTYFVLRDSTNHAPKTDVTITDIDLYYCEQGAAMAAKVDATALAAADSAHADNKAFHVGQGLYRIDWPDEAFNGGVGKVANLIVVCTGVDTTFLEVELVGVAQTGDAYARLGAPAGASVSADIADLPTVTEFEARTIAAADYTIVSDLPTVPSAADNATAVAAAILETPANLLKTDAAGRVEVSGTKNTLDALNDAADAPSAASVADAVWNETLGDHAVAGSTGAALSAAGSAGDPWLTDLPGAYADGTAGDIIGNLIDDIGAITPAVAISATQAASVSTGALAIRTHHTLSQAITSTTTSDLSAATKLWLTVKSRRTDTDAQAVVFIEETAGLTVLAGAPYITVAHGTLVVTGNAGAWTVTVGMDEIATGLLKDYAESMLWAECKALVGGSTVAVWDGVCDVSHGLVVAVA